MPEPLESPRKPARIERIAVYGKGGVGKSVIATSLSARYAMDGLRVLHVGCDPKADSAIRLLDGLAEVRTVLDVLGNDPSAEATSEILNTGRHGIHCCEAGGPHAGLGCGGRGVARMIEYLDEMQILESGAYDIAMFDVLGDVVCGGFAAPLRDRFAEKVIIVISEQPMSLFAANNISRAVDVYKRNGVILAGLVLNQHDPATDTRRFEYFAERLNTRLLSVIPRESRIMEGENQQRTIVEYAPESNAAKALADLAGRLLALDASVVPPPTPLGDNEFFALMRDMGG
jgi:nitrogenase iron protein NifH